MSLECRQQSHTTATGVHMFKPQARSAVEREARRVAGMLIEKAFASHGPARSAAATFTLVSWQQPQTHSRREDEQAKRAQQASTS